MKYLELTLPTAAENLACDEALLDQAEAGTSGEALRFWTPTEVFVVVGYANNVNVEVNVPACQAAGIGIFRRCTGGGTVLQGPGCLNYTLILQIAETGPLQSITGTNQFILERQKRALEPLIGRAVEISGHTDLAIENLKFSGNAQRRRRRFCVFHGTFLLNFDLELIERFLRAPSKQPEYRHDRTHREFLTNLNLPVEAVKQSLREVWRADQQLESDLIPNTAIQALSQARYSQPEWNLRF